MSELKSPSYVSEPQFLSIRKLIEDIQGGYILVPRFQRPFVWSDDQRLELLRSIKDSMPIGSVLLWRTSKLQLACYETLGPHRLTVVQQVSTAGWSYLLDGHQRLSTLYGALQRPEGGPAPDVDVDWDIQYDLAEEEFVFVRGRARSSRPLMPLWMALDIRSVRQLGRNLDERRKKAGWSEDDVELWLQRADDLAYRFQEYRVPVIPMATDELSLATRTFQRVNSQGTPMNEVHMVAALTWTQSFDLRELLEEERQRLPEGWQEVEDRIILNICKGLEGLDVTKTGEQELANRLGKNHRLISRAVDALERAAHFFANQSLLGANLVPYALQIVLMAVALDASPKPSSKSVKAMQRWFALTTTWGTFASATWKAVQAAQLHLCALARGERPEWKLPIPSERESLPSRFDFRSARARDFALRMALRPGLADSDGAPINGPTLLQLKGPRAIVRLFRAPHDATIDKELELLLAGSANCFILPSEQMLRFRFRMEQGPDLPNDTLEAHLITPPMLKTLRVGGLKKFLEARLARMEREDETWYEALHPHEFPA